MKSIPKPTIKAKNVFLDCISTVKDANLKQAYSDCIDLIELAEVEFEKQFSAYQIFQILQSSIVKGIIDKDEMEKVYTYRMVSPKMPGNKYYNILKSLAPQGKCPLCSVREVSTLDHYLPKALYPALAVTPVNLIPSCSDCNKTKKSSFPNNSVEQTLHPYFDNLETESWIKAEVINYSPISFHFYVDCPSQWTQLQKDRAKNHFKVFNLNYLFMSNANEEIRGAIDQLQNLYIKKPTLLIDQLRDSYESKKNRLGINAWQTVMYFSLYNDERFITGEIMSFDYE